MLTTSFQNIKDRDADHKLPEYQR